MEGLDIGACRSKWTLDYLAKQLGDRQVRRGVSKQHMAAIDADVSPVQVVVHECKVRSMDFNAKNFRYTSMAFDEFAREVQNGARFYLRALSADAPANRPANLAHDFPSLAGDFVLPEALNMCSENMHSSVLRVSGQVSLPAQSPQLPHGVASIPRASAPLPCCGCAIRSRHLGANMPCVAPTDLN